MFPLNKFLFKTLSILIVFGMTVLIVNIRLLTVKEMSSKWKVYMKSRHVILDELITTVGEPGLNRHVWDVEAKSIDFLCNIPLFPKAPDSRIRTDRLEVTQTEKEKYAERIFGFVCPLKSGRYEFAIASDDSSEIWLSSDGTVSNSKLIAYIGEKRDSKRTEKNNFTTFPSQISKQVELQAGGRYFIEVLHVSRRNHSHLTVFWKEPGKSFFSSIQKEYLIPYFNNDLNPDNIFYDFEIPVVTSCQKTIKKNPFLIERQLLYSQHNLFAHILPACQSSNPRDLLRQQRYDLNITKYGSLREKYCKKTFVYSNKPIDNHVYDYGQKFLPWWGKVSLSKESAKQIVGLFWEKTMRNSGKNFTLKSIINIEKTNFQNGSRYLVELDMLTTLNDTIHFSEYIYHHNNTLCYLSPWRRDVLITFVVTAKDQGKWIHIFLDNMASIIERTQDLNFKAVIFDYDSQDIDLAGAVAWRGLEDRVKIVRKQGMYSRRESFNLAIKHVDDPNSIVFLLDLHLTIGDGFLNDIRKHTIQGQNIYTPVIVRQWEITTPNNGYYGWYGFYETYGFGLVGIYKSDWDLVGGFPQPYEGKNETYKWGGEDYELMDSVFRQGLEYIRVKCPYVYHYKHSRKGMWNNNDKKGFDK